MLPISICVLAHQYKAISSFDLLFQALWVAIICNTFKRPEKHWSLLLLFFLSEMKWKVRERNVLILWKYLIIPFASLCVPGCTPLLRCEAARFHLTQAWSFGLWQNHSDSTNMHPMRNYWQLQAWFRCDNRWEKWLPESALLEQRLLEQRTVLLHGKHVFALLSTGFSEQGFKNRLYYQSITKSCNTNTLAVNTPNDVCVCVSMCVFHNYLLVSTRAHQNIVRWGPS